MILLSRPRRARRAHEWAVGKAVTFIVTLAATRSVTLAARGAGMSRKSAYALKSRDPEFADAWKRALNARPTNRPSGEMTEVQTPPDSLDQGDIATRAARSTWSTRRAAFDRQLQDAARDNFFARLAANLDRPKSPAKALLTSSGPPSPSSPRG